MLVLGGLGGGVRPASPAYAAGEAELLTGYLKHVPIGSLCCFGCGPSERELCECMRRHGIAISHASKHPWGAMFQTRLQASA